MKCPCCKKPVLRTHFACEMASKGGSTKGDSKRRSPEQLKAAIAARWPKKAKASKPQRKKRERGE